MRLNRFLFVLLGVFMIVVGVSVVLAVDGNGSIDGDYGGDNYTSSSDVDPDVEYGSEVEGNVDDGGNRVSVSLSEYETC